MIGCSAEQEGPNLIYLNQLILHAALNQKMRGERVFFYEELVFFDRVRGKALQVPYIPANRGGVIGKRDYWIASQKKKSYDQQRRVGGDLHRF
jgi:hypothetical protein